jgi:hypothetical protein
VRCIVDGGRDAAFAYWDDLAEAAFEINRKPRPRQAENADVVLQVAVEWDV